MKFPLHLLLASSTLPTSSAYLPAPPPALHGRLLDHPPGRPRSSSRLHYKPSSPEDAIPPGDDGSVWSVLASTERWISDTLDRTNRAANARRRQSNSKPDGKPKPHFADEKESGGGGGSVGGVGGPVPGRDNPYARKEVSYACETGSDAAGVVGGVFRRVREAREAGETHGRGVEARADGGRPATMRQTNVVVIPNCGELADFRVFDRLVHAVNQARRAGRDFVVRKKDDMSGGGGEWVVSINCAHLHPQYGAPSPEEQLASLKHEEEEGEVDLNMAEHKRRRDEARRSPYPSVIVEVQSTPPPDFGATRDAAATEEAVRMEANRNKKPDEDVTSDDVRRLEALFGMSAATKGSGSKDDPFYDALGEAFGKKQIASQTPLSRAQNWVLENDPAFDERTSTFTKSDTRHVDAAYEYVFNNLAMLDAEEEGGAAGGRRRRGSKGYVVLPDFLPTSATSFDRFAGQVSNIVRAVPSMAERVMVSTFHPEHVVASTRAPVPIVVITWK